MSDEDLNEAAEDPNVDIAAEDGADDGDEKSGFNAKKIIMFVVLPLLLLGGAGGGLYFSGFLDPYLGKAEECVEELDEDGNVIKECPEKMKEEYSGGEGKESGANAFIEIPTMIVNLSEEDGTPRYLRLSVQLELKNPDDTAKVEAVMPRVVDQFQTYLRELRVRDLRGSAGIYRLQMELLWRVNQAASPVEVKDVLFQEILIQ